jgi:2-dehydro-3-deoxyphosphogluconate aldolase/(4S)-4-hydroxy-2-oxoglutarate aldolase
VGTSMEDILARARVVPVITIDNPDVAPDLAHALIAGGLATIEITLRTPQGLAAISRIAREVPNCVIGAGTVLSAADMRHAAGVGATFAVSPGATDTLYGAALELDLPFLPGVVSPSEIMRGMDAGHHIFKFYPAEQSGGSGFLRNIALPFPQARFCATGGLNGATALEYARLPNVIAVGGFWMAPKEMIARRAWDDITHLAKSAIEAVTQVE